MALSASANPLPALLSDALSLVWPRVCAACGEPSPGARICDACRARVEVRPATACCAVCGCELVESDAALGSAEPLCGACRARRPAFERARSAARFAGPVRPLVHALKYGHSPWLAGDLSEWLHGCVLARWPREPFDLICPVPLHRRRERTRGYNQSALLARALARRLGLPAAPRLLERIRDTPRQTRLDAAARRANVAGAFRIRPGSGPLAWGRTILLVDDVMTTGATLDAAARALRDAGAGRVFALSLARG
jgi:ComF family protein